MEIQSEEETNDPHREHTNQWRVRYENGIIAGGVFAETQALSDGAQAYLDFLRATIMNRLNEKREAPFQEGFILIRLCEW